MSHEYEFTQIERQVQEHWQQQRSFEVTEDPSKPKYYCLSMLPYPSGSLHIGHVRNYTIGDVISRFRRMQGFNVLQPMGWDAFGMPAENAAIANQSHPAKWTYSNIEKMRTQLQSLGIAYDWTREFATCAPEYYQHEQWFFTELLKRGIAYRKKGAVNWCETDQTVLANEQVEEGCCWRCGNPVERRDIAQWYLRITDYAQELLDGLDDLPHWPESVKTMQRNWIGRSEGVEFDWMPEDFSGDVLRAYTTRPDTIMGVTFMAVAPEHPVAQAIAESRADVSAFIAECQQSGTSEAVIEKQEKRGMALGVHVRHPVSGQPVPVWVANYVLMGYGGGAVMGVPAHDQRDWDFATKYGIEIVQVVDSAKDPVSIAERAYPDKSATVAINSGQFDGLDHKSACNAVADYLCSHANGERKVNFRLRDWLVSRQRYWGCPIPVVYDEDGAAHPAEALPVVLPEDIEYTGGNTLRSSEAFAQTTVNGRPGRREVDTFDTFFESSWYYARYCSPGASEMLDERANYWLPVNQYIGGIEHAVMHLLYFRFFHKLMRDLGLVNSDEPCERLLTQGMVLGETFSRQVDGKTQYFYPHEVALQFDAKGAVVGATLKADGEAVDVGPAIKMSKSKNNGADPGTIIDRYGVDTVRLFSMFGAPPDQSLEWRESGVEGMHRFLKRLWRCANEYLDAGGVPKLDRSALSTAHKALRYKIHHTIAKVSDDVERRYTFNTAIAAMMELVNELTRADQSGAGRAVVGEGLVAVVTMLSPFTPHLSHVLLERLCEGDDVAAMDRAWPQVDESALVQDEITIVVQVNGKVRTRITVPADADQAQLLALAKADVNVQQHLEGKTVRKEIVVPGKLVNIVAN